MQDIADTVDLMIKGIYPKCRIKMSKHPISTNWIDFAALDQDSHVLLIRTAMPFITANCYDTLTSMGTLPVPKHFPVKGSLEVNDFYFPDEVLSYLNARLKEYTEERQ